MSGKIALLSCQNTLKKGILVLLWRDVREVEGESLENFCTLTAYRGFESLSLRQNEKQLPL